MNFESGSKDAFMAAYKFYLIDNSSGSEVEKPIGIIHEDGATMRLEEESKEVINGHDRSLFGKWKWIKYGNLEFKVIVYDIDTLKLALPHAEVNGNVIKLKTGVSQLHKLTQKFVARPEGYETDDSKKITIYSAVNDNNFEVTFKSNEETQIPFNLLCLKDDNGDFIDIGEETTTV